MNISHPFTYQYRTFEHTYLFKIKPHQDLSLKILDLSQNLLFKKTFSSHDLPLNINQLVTKSCFAVILNDLRNKQLLSQKHLSEEFAEETCLNMLDQKINQLKSKTLGSKEIKEFTCPFTLETFQEPVMDEHGHTFEKRMIETHLQQGGVCPINRQPIHLLIPNRTVQQAIEADQNKEFVPNFSLFQKENPKLAEAHLNAARAHTEEEQYQEALEAYAKAFQYTKKLSDYASLPSLLESMGENEKATLAYLYLTKYHLQAEDTQGAIQSLETSQKRPNAPFEGTLVLIELYKTNNEPSKALDFSIQTAKTISQRSPKQAINLYKRILRNTSFDLSLYTQLGALLENSQEQTHVFLKGALQALQEANYEAAENLAKQRNNLSEESFIDSLVSVEISLKKGQTAKAKAELHRLATAFESKNLAKKALSIYKILFGLDKQLKNALKILAAYRTLQKPQKELKWSLVILSHNVEKKQWKCAEKTAQQALEKAFTSKQRLPFYEKLEEVYTHWHTHKLQALWPKLGKAQQDNHQLEKAEETLKKAVEHSPSFETHLSLAQTLRDLKKVQKSVSSYYEAAIAALVEDDVGKLSHCIQEMKQVDPILKHLTSDQKAHVLSQEKTMRLSKDLQVLNEKVASLESMQHQQAARIGVTVVTLGKRERQSANQQEARPNQPRRRLHRERTQPDPSLAEVLREIQEEYYR